MMRSSTGAARVSAVWMIAAGVLFLVALVFAFISQSDLSKKEAQLQLARESEAAAQQDATTRANERRDLSQLLGWYDRQSADPSSDVAAVKEAMSGLRSTFPDISETDKDFQSMLPKIEAAFAARQKKIDELQTRIDALEAELATSKQTASTVRDDKDAVIAQLRQQLADAEERAQQREQDLQERLASSQDQLSDRDARLRETVAEAEETERDFRKELRTKETKIKHLAEDTKLTQEPFSQLPDGEVIDVSSRVNIGYIDLGASDRVTRGLRFRIESSSPGGARTKAWAEVSKVFPDYSEITIMNLVDRYDPVVKGDKIVNPIFDPETERRAVLVGRFSAPYDRAEVTSILEKMNIRVQDELSIDTNYLVVGSELYEDPETGEPVETPIPPSALDVYKKAENLGVVVVPIERLRDFFQAYSSSVAKR